MKIKYNIPKPYRLKRYFDWIESKDELWAYDNKNFAEYEEAMKLAKDYVSSAITFFGKPITLKKALRLIKKYYPKGTYIVVNSRLYVTSKGEERLIKVTVTKR